MKTLTLKTLTSKTIALSACFLISVGAAASDMVPGKTQSRPILLQGGDLNTVSNGVMTSTDLLLQAGKISAIGKGLEVPDNAQVIDVSGKQVYPGLFALANQLGLVEVEAVRSTDDTIEVGDNNANVEARIAFNTDSEIIPTVRSNGITHALVYPVGDMVMGRSSLMKMDAWNWQDGTEQADVGLHIKWPASKVKTSEKKAYNEAKEKSLQQRQALDEILAKARHYTQSRNDLRVDSRLEGWRDVLAGKLPLYVHANDKRQIQQAMQFADDQGLKITIVGGQDSWMLADELAAAKIAVVYKSPYELPMRWDEAHDQPFRTPAQLAEAGVTFGFTLHDYGWDWNNRNLPFAAGYAVAFGLDKERALRALTLDAAEIAGVADRLGSLEVGKQATVIVSRGDVMDFLGHSVEWMFIDGRQVDLNNRHKQMTDKYRQRLQN